MIASTVHFGHPPIDEVDMLIDLVPDALDRGRSLSGALPHHVNDRIVPTLPIDVGTSDFFEANMLVKC